MRSDLSADLKALQEDLQVKYGNDSPLLARKHTSETMGDETSICRKPSVGYMEENYATGRYENESMYIYPYMFFYDLFMRILQIERQLFNIAGTLACVTKFGFFKDDLGGIVPF